MKNLLNLFRWQDALDILILTYIFYHLYLWLRKKKALRMILAILALPLFYIFARWIDLPLSVWGLQNLWPVILIVLVVDFSGRNPRSDWEISASPLSSLEDLRELTSKTMDKIVEATFQMADKKIGGLIVLQRGDDLDELIHEKTPVNAEINEDFLVSIFNSQSPLHDGAVIISGDRIRYAAALLPLSKSTSLPERMGNPTSGWSRHHRSLRCRVHHHIGRERGGLIRLLRGRYRKKMEEED